MTLQSSSAKFKTFFLIEFTKQLINNSKTDYIIAIENLKKEQIKNKLKEKKLFMKVPRKKFH